MPTFQIAHLRERDSLGHDIDLIIVPMQSSFGQLSDAAQAEAIQELQIRSHAANLAGTVCPVWEQGGRFMFIADRNWHPYFKSLSMGLVHAAVNRELRW